MTTSMRIRTMAVAVAAACAAIGTAHADSAVGVDTVLGNAMNRSGFGCAPGLREPIDNLRSAPTRSPTGYLNPFPGVLGPDVKTDSDWEVAGCVEFGGLFGDNDEKAALFRKYKDLDTGAYLNSFWFHAEKPDTAQYFEAIGGGVGQNDQYYGLRYGKYNSWRVTAFYNETPHVFTSTYRSLWNGIGSDNLTLDNAALVAGGLPTAAATQTALQNVLANTPYSTLEIIRKKGGLGYNMRISDELRGYATLTSEKREGARPFGAVFGGGGGGGNFEVAESIDYSTHDLQAGIAYVDPLNSLNVVLSASFFRNDAGTMRFENPLTVTTNTIAGISANAFTSGRYDLYPDNDAYSIKADYARSLPALWNGRLAVSAAYTSMRQDDDLIAPTEYSLSGATLNGIPATNRWNSPSALMQQSADAQIDTMLFNVNLALNPISDLTVNARYRYYDTDNSTEYLACNPSTGQLGRLLNDGSGGALVNTPAYLAAACNLAAVRALNVTPSAGNITLLNIPFEYSQQNYGVTADWRFARGSALVAAYEREEYRRDYRERDKTWEDKFKLTASTSALQWATLRASYEYADRRGSDYVVDPYEEFVSASLGPYPTTGNVASWIHNIASFRKFDLADREQNTFNLRANFLAGENIDASVNLQSKRAEYPDSEYGRIGKQDQDSISLDLNYQAFDGLSIYGFYSYQTADMEQRGIQPLACTIGAGGVTAANFVELCEAAGGPLFPLNRFWFVDSKDRNHTAGIGTRYDLKWVQLDVDYLYTLGETAISYQYGDGLGLTPVQASLAGTGWPDLKYRLHTVSASAVIPVHRNVAVRLIGQYESGRIDDWHYLGVDGNPVPANNAVYLDSGPTNYHAAIFGVLLRLRL